VTAEVVLSWPYAKLGPSMCDASDWTGVSGKFVFTHFALIYLGNLCKYVADTFVRSIQKAGAVGLLWQSLNPSSGWWASRRPTWSTIEDVTIPMIVVYPFADLVAAVKNSTTTATIFNDGNLWMWVFTWPGHRLFSYIWFFLHYAGAILAMYVIKQYFKKNKRLFAAIPIACAIECACFALRGTMFEPFGPIFFGMPAVDFANVVWKLVNMPRVLSTFILAGQFVMLIIPKGRFGVKCGTHFWIAIALMCTICETIDLYVNIVDIIGVASNPVVSTQLTRIPSYVMYGITFPLFFFLCVFCHLQAAKLRIECIGISEDCPHSDQVDCHPIYLSVGRHHYYDSNASNCRAQ